MYWPVGRVDEASSVVTRDLITFLGTREYRVVGLSATVVEFEPYTGPIAPRKTEVDTWRLQKGVMEAWVGNQHIFTLGMG